MKSKKHQAYEEASAFLLSFCQETVQGKRPQNEDVGLTLTRGPITLYGVFDGHGGSEVSAALSEEMSILLEKLRPDHFRDGLTFRKFITQEYRRIDKQFYDTLSDNARTVGSTAVLALYDATSHRLYLVNLGDSRGLLIRGGSGWLDDMQLVTTRDHKPAEPGELARIQHSGGVVTQMPRNVPRVAGVLALSRAFGDFDLKRPFNRARGDWVSVVPEVIGPLSLDPTRPYVLILASDGLFDVLKNEEVIIETIESLEQGNMEEACSVLAQKAVKRWEEGPGGDNVTAIVAEIPAKN